MLLTVSTAHIVQSHRYKDYVIDVGPIQMNGHMDWSCRKELWRWKVDECWNRNDGLSQSQSIQICQSFWWQFVQSDTSAAKLIMYRGMVFVELKLIFDVLNESASICDTNETFWCLFSALHKLIVRVSCQFHCSAARLPTITASNKSPTSNKFL